jgi:RND family efflux transporter MFP subunit
MSWTIPITRRVSLVLLATLMALPLGCKEEEKHPEEEHAAPVEWEPYKKADLEEWTELLGVTQPLPSRVAEVSAATGGLVVTVLPSEKGKAIVEGQRVEKGQLLVRLDDRVLRANRERLVVSDPELKEQIRQAEHQVELARIEVVRLERLQSNSGGAVPLVTQLELDKARLSLKDAESKQKATQAKEEIARAEVKAIDEQLELYTLRAPISGQLGMIHAHPGQTLAAGATVAEIIDLDDIDVLCFVPPSTVSRLQLGQVVRIETGSNEPTTDDPKSVEGKIVFISDQAQAETGTVAVKARFNNQKRKLRANTLVRVRVLTETKSDCITIPESALLEDQDEAAVLVVETKTKKDEHDEEKEEHHVRRLEVKLGIRDRKQQRVEILEMIEVKEEKHTPVNLDKDTLFVTKGGHGLEDGDLVEEKKEEHEEEKKDEKKNDANEPGGPSTS